MLHIFKICNLKSILIRNCLNLIAYFKYFIICNFKFSLALWSFVALLVGSNATLLLYLFNLFFSLSNENQIHNGVLLTI